MQKRGFIALMSAIIISAILLLVAATAALATLNTRFNTLDSELKGRSSDAADACVDQALLQLAQNGSITVLTFTLNSLDQCTIGKFSSTGSQYMFETQGTSNHATTNLSIVIDSSDLSIVSWQEIPTF